MSTRQKEVSCKAWIYWPKQEEKGNSGKQINSIEKALNERNPACVSLMYLLFSVTSKTPLSFVFAEALVKFQHGHTNTAGEGWRKNMMEFSFALRSSRFLSSNYPEVLPDAFYHF